VGSRVEGSDLVIEGRELEGGAKHFRH